MRTPDECVWGAYSVVKGIPNSVGRRGIFRIFDCVSPTRRALAVCCVMTCAACAAIVSRPPKLSPTAGAVRRDAAAQELHVLHEGDVARCRSPAVQCRTGAPLPITTNQNCYGTCYGTVPDQASIASSHPPSSARAAAKCRCFCCYPLLLLLLTNSIICVMCDV